MEWTADEMWRALALHQTLVVTEQRKLLADTIARHGSPMQVAVQCPGGAECPLRKVGS